MKFGLRVPSLKKRFAARTSWKRVARHSLGLKAPKGYGFITHPKKFSYNKIYNKTSFGIGSLFKSGGNANGNAMMALLTLVAFVLFLPFILIYFIVKYQQSKR